MTHDERPGAPSTPIDADARDQVGSAEEPSTAVSPAPTTPPAPASGPAPTPESTDGMELATAVDAGPSVEPALDAEPAHESPETPAPVVFVPPPPKQEQRGRAKKIQPPCRRPKQPHDWRWVAGGIGKSLIVIAVLIYAFVAYQLWGTNLQYARSQQDLEDEFATLVEQAAAISTPPEPSTSAPPATAPPTTVPGVPPPPETTPPETTTTVDPTIGLLTLGGALGKIEIPKIGLNDIIVAGVRVQDLKKGVGHFPDTPLPGQTGNSALAGHRTTYGAPFSRIDELDPGDPIVVTTLQGTFTYLVTGTRIVEPTEYSVVSTQPDTAMLTLTSCEPRYSARKRIVVTADLDTSGSDPVEAPVVNYGLDVELPTGIDQGTPDGVATDDATATTVAGEEPASVADEQAAEEAEEAAELAALEGEDAFSQGWFSDSGAWLPVILWGLVVAGVGFGAWYLGRRTRYWIGALAGIVPFVVVLYFWYENVERLLPPGL